MPAGRHYVERRRYAIPQPNKKGPRCDNTRAFDTTEMNCFGKEPETVMWEHVSRFDLGVEP
jgi:hypothetical protein